MRHLIVDDDDMNRMIFKLMLEKIQSNADVEITIDEADDGPDAINIIKSQPSYDFIWMDLQLKTTDGITCTKYIRDKLQHHGKIIAITGHTDEHMQQKCMESGMDGILCKPIFIEQLESILQE